jgi:hypothetical protein
VTGSGSAVFGVYRDPAAARLAAESIRNAAWMHVGRILSRRQSALVDELEIRPGRVKAQMLREEPDGDY